jgi:hypothetical protein
MFRPNEKTKKLEVLPTAQPFFDQRAIMAATLARDGQTQAQKDYGRLTLQQLGESNFIRDVDYRKLLQGSLPVGVPGAAQPGPGAEYKTGQPFSVNREARMPANKLIIGSPFNPNPSVAPPGSDFTEKALANPSNWLAAPEYLPTPGNILKQGLIQQYNLNKAVIGGAGNALDRLRKDFYSGPK